MVVELSNAGDQLPTIPLFEVVGRAFKVPPIQIGETAVNVGVMLELTVIVIEVDVAHCPASGEKVYVVVVVLSNAGDQVPVIPLVEIRGKAFSVPPIQIGETALNVGVTGELTVTVCETETAHCPTAGVNEYNVVAVLFNAGDQVPVIAFVEVVGKVAKKSPEQIGATTGNIGVILGFTVTVNVVVVPHCPASGVNE